MQTFDFCDVLAFYGVWCWGVRCLFACCMFRASLFCCCDPVLEYQMLVWVWSWNWLEFLSCCNPLFVWSSYDMWSTVNCLFSAQQFEMNVSCNSDTDSWDSRFIISISVFLLHSCFTSCAIVSLWKNVSVLNPCVCHGSVTARVRASGGMHALQVHLHADARACTFLTLAWFAVVALDMDFRMSFVEFILPSLSLFC